MAFRQNTARVLQRSAVGVRNNVNRFHCPQSLLDGLNRRQYFCAHAFSIHNGFTAMRAWPGR